MRTRLRGVGLALLLVLAPPAAVRAQGTGIIPEQKPQIVTSAQSEVRVVPDRATILIGVQTRATTAAAAASQNARRQRAVIDAVKALDIPANQISTVGLNVYPETRFDKDSGQQRVTGYVVSNVVRVEVHRVDQVGPVVDAALGKGANQINSLQFTASNADEARRDALTEAVAKARADADALARAAGGHLGGLLELTESGGYPTPMFEFQTRAAMAGVAPTPVEPGEITVRANVTARWAFVAGTP